MHEFQAQRFVNVDVAWRLVSDLWGKNLWNDLFIYLTYFFIPLIYKNSKRCTWFTFWVQCNHFSLFSVLASLSLSKFILTFSWKNLMIFSVFLSSCYMELLLFFLSSGFLKEELKGVFVISSGRKVARSLMVVAVNDMKTHNSIWCLLPTFASECWQTHDRLLEKKAPIFFNSKFWVLHD